MRLCCLRHVDVDVEYGEQWNFQEVSGQDGELEGAHGGDAQYANIQDGGAYG